MENPWRPFNVGKKEYVKIPFIKKNNIDFIMDSQDATNSNATESLYPHAKDDWVAAIPASGFRTQYSHLLQIFKEGLGVMLMFFIFICPLLWFILHDIETGLNNGTRRNRLKFLFAALFDNFRIVLGSSLYKLPKYGIEKFFLVCLLLCYLIINNYFQSILISILTITDFERQINTLEELSESSVKVGVPPGMLQVIYYYFNQTEQFNLVQKLQELNMTKYYRIQENVFTIPTEIGVIANFDRIEYLSKQRPVFHMVQESFIPMFCSYHMTRGSPYKEMFQSHVTRIIEAGLYSLWKRQTNDAWLKMNLTDTIDTGGFKAISLNNFRGSFYILFFGLGLSLFVFFVEIMCSRLSNSNI